MTTSLLFLMPLTFASNIFVGLETMPGWLQAIVKHNPVTHLANASRGLMHGQDVTADVLWVLLASAAIVGVSAPVAMRMYHARALTPAAAVAEWRREAQSVSLELLISKRV